MLRSNAPRRSTGGGMTPEQLKKMRAELAALCAQSIDVFALPCRKCKVDWDEKKAKYKADPEKPFAYGAIAFLTEEGDLDADKVYLVHVSELSSKSGKLAFGYGKDRVIILCDLIEVILRHI